MRPHALSGLLCVLALTACTRTAEDTADTEMPVDTGSEDTDTDTEEDAPAADFSVAAASSVAGEVVALTVTLTYSDGTVETPAYTLTSSLEDALDVGDGTVTPTLAGAHTLTATLTESGSTLTASLDVSPAAAANVELTATPSEGIDPDGFTITKVVQVDAFGNTTTEEVVFTTDPEGPVVAEDSVTFPAEGSFLLTATTTSGASHTVGPIVVDATGPELLLSAPARGDILPEGSNALEGTVIDDLSEVTDATLDGAALTLDGSGAFSHSVDLAFGMTLLDGSATDADGNSSTSVTALVAGDVEALGTEDADGLVLRVYEGPDGLDALATAATSSLDAAAIYSALPAPLYETSGQDCQVFAGFLVCFNYSALITATDLSIASIDSTLDPSADETLLLTVTATDLELPWRINAVVNGQAVSRTGLATVDVLRMESELTLTVSNGTLVAEVVSTNTEIEGLDVGITNGSGGLPASAGDPTPEVEATLEAAVNELMQAQLGAELTQAMSGIGISETLPLAATSATLTGVPSDVTIDDSGLTIALATTVQLDTDWPTTVSNPGALRHPFSAPTYSTGTGSSAALSGDVLNQLLYASYGAGVLNTTASNEELGLDMSTVSLLLPALTDLTMVVTPTYAPLVRPNAAADGLELQVADLRVNLYNGDVEPSLLTYALYASLESDVELVVDDAAISLNTTSPEFTADVVLAPPGTNTASLESALELLMVLVVDDLTGSIAAIPLPSVAGASLVGGTAAVAGAEGGYIEVSGTLVASP